MNIHAVSKGVVLYFALIFSAMSLFIFNGFQLTERTFTLVLLGIIIVIGFFTGKHAGENSGLNGFLIGIITSAFLIFFISPYTDMQWGLNFFIMIVWISISTVSAYVGGKFDVVTKSFKLPKVNEKQ
ncbi:hypothetical protein [Bacillus thuringiensis]|uniref:hypothetical protein n=1 Tax=Bacillus thuringiensis TaxID=1428 RepID=UPI0021D68A11|nr:hypothetical protein [Bacillus thuringiensis]MCU7668034.1 hypothetical protein [Bacillus thuringiensis]